MTLFKFKPNAVILGISNGYNAIPVIKTNRSVVKDNTTYYECRDKDGNYKYELLGNIYLILPPV